MAKAHQEHKLAEKLGAELQHWDTRVTCSKPPRLQELGQFNAASTTPRITTSRSNAEDADDQVSVDAAGVVLYANRNPDGTVTMVPLAALTNPAPTTSLGQAKQTIATPVVVPTTTRTTVMR